MADAVVRLTFPAKADYLLLARLALAGISRSVVVDEDVLADLKLAVTEACGNAVRHAYGNGEGSVEVVFLVGPERIEMTVEDRGAGLGDPLEPAKIAGEPLEGGMGIAIIKAVVDELDVRDGADGHGTIVRMTKYLEPAVG
ncbi:MAG: ATP-binding protein [Gaiellaceae bacterium]